LSRWRCSRLMNASPFFRQAFLFDGPSLRAFLLKLQSSATSATLWLSRGRWSGLFLSRFLGRAFFPFRQRKRFFLGSALAVLGGGLGSGRLTRHGRSGGGLGRWLGLRNGLLYRSLWLLLNRGMRGRGVYGRHASARRWLLERRRLLKRLRLLKGRRGCHRRCRSVFPRGRRYRQDSPETQVHRLGHFDVLVFFRSEIPRYRDGGVLVQCVWRRLVGSVQGEHLPFALGTVKGLVVFIEFPHAFAGLALILKFFVHLYPLTPRKRRPAAKPRQPRVFLMDTEISTPSRSAISVSPSIFSIRSNLSANVSPLT